MHLVPLKWDVLWAAHLAAKWAAQWAVQEIFLNGGLYDAASDCKVGMDGPA